jgi:leucyl-tRNA synthetase
MLWLSISFIAVSGTQKVRMNRKSTAKLTEFLEIERQVQELWAREHVFEMDAPPLDESDQK